MPVLERAEAGNDIVRNGVGHGAKPGEPARGRPRPPEAGPCQVRVVGFRPDTGLIPVAPAGPVYALDRLRRERAQSAPAGYGVAPPPTDTLRGHWSGGRTARWRVSRTGTRRFLESARGTARGRPSEHTDG
ncbi:hypothetical protein GCM10010104_24790 [Streptomyces indiaensis]|uniref:Uncharacterized protein n=1 Tax=Streptomyces indiaensis TaxID=284033 RepID=A0ABN3DGJ4_9ACTN